MLLEPKVLTGTDYNLLHRLLIQVPHSIQLDELFTGWGYPPSILEKLRRENFAQMSVGCLGRYFRHMMKEYYTSLAEAYAQEMRTGNIAGLQFMAMLSMHPSLVEALEAYFTLPVTRKASAFIKNYLETNPIPQRINQLKGLYLHPSTFEILRDENMITKRRLLTLFGYIIEAREREMFEDALNLFKKRGFRSMGGILKDAITYESQYFFDRLYPVECADIRSYEAIFRVACESPSTYFFDCLMRDRRPTPALLNDIVLDFTNNSVEARTHILTTILKSGHVRMSTLRAAFKYALRDSGPDFEILYSYARQDVGLIAHGLTKVKLYQPDRVGALVSAAKNIDYVEGAWEILAGRLKQLFDSGITQALKVHTCCHFLDQLRPGSLMAIVPGAAATEKSVQILKQMRETPSLLATKLKLEES